MFFQLIFLCFLGKYPKIWFTFLKFTTHFSLKLSDGPIKWVYLKISERYGKSLKSLTQNGYLSKLP